MPISRAHSATARTARTPIRCPSTRGSPRSAAHRPFPSMMTATCRGRAGAAEPVDDIVIAPDGQDPSDLQDLLLLGLEDLFDPLHAGVRLLLDPVLPPLDVVLGDLLFFLAVLEFLDRLPPHVADGHPGILGHLPDDLRELLPPLLGQRRNRDA